MANKNFYKAIAAGSKVSGIPFNEIRDHYRDKDLKASGKLGQGVIFARNRYKALKNTAEATIEA